jgi:hypothetical protein
MTVLPNDPAAIVLGTALRDPGETRRGRDEPLSASLPRRRCPNCTGTGWINEPFFGATLGTRCPCRGA